MSKKNTDTLVGFVLDKSDSMRSVQEDTVNGFNEYLKKLKGDETPTLLSLWAFNSFGIDTIYDFEDMDSVPYMKRSDYRPDGLTPLYDSVSKGIKEIEDFIKSRPGNWNVIFTIMTDGIENYSHSYSRQEVFDLIKKKEASGWAFIYLGANQDAWEVAGSIGIGRQYSASYDASNPDGTLRTVAASTLRGKSAMRKGRKPRDMFTSEEREKFMEKKFGIRRP